MVAADLVVLKAPPILIAAAREGLIAALECAMPECLCPEGRSHFVAATGRRGPWIPTPDRWPVPGRDGGEYVPSNVRLAHARCNYSDGNRVGVERAHASGWYGSERQRELSRRNMKKVHETWGKTEEAFAQRSRIGKINGHTRSAETMTKAGKAGEPGLRRWQATPQGHSVSVENGKRLAAGNATPEGRARWEASRHPVSAEAAARLADNFADWQGTPESKAHYARLGEGLAARNKTPEMRAKFSAAQLARASRPGSHAEHVRSGQIAACARWQVGRGKSCVCGKHE